MVMKEFYSIIIIKTEENQLGKKVELLQWCVLFALTLSIISGVRVIVVRTLTQMHGFTEKVNTTRMELVISLT